MKDMLTAAIAMAVIILIQVILSFTLTYQVAETFSNASFILLFCHYLRKSNHGKIDSKLKTAK